MKHHQSLIRFVLMAVLFLFIISFVSPAQAREIWLNPVEAGKKAVGDWGGVKFKKEVHFHWRVPSDFDITFPQSGTATLLVIGLKKQDLNYRVNVSVAGNDEAQDTFQSTIDSIQGLAAGQLTEIPITGVLPNMVPGEYVALNFERVGKKKVKAIIVGMRYNYNPVILDLADLQAELAVLQNIFAGVSRNGNDIFFDTVNVHVRDGSGATDGLPGLGVGTPNGLGNLIVGYDEVRNFGGAVNNKTGSNNLVVGEEHNYLSYGGLVAGLRNTVSGPNASVSGGFNNEASGPQSSVIGGQNNIASDEDSSVSGGGGNTASGLRSSVSGGQNNTASERESSVSGGAENIASAFGSSVSGGVFNQASGTGASVSGGEANTASAIRSSVSGGNDNTASGQTSSVSGGEDNTASGINSSVSGGVINTASGNNSSVSGGAINTASGTESSVKGGENNTASATRSSVSGGAFNQANGSNSSVSGGFLRSAPASRDWVAGGLFQDQ